MNVYVDIRCLQDARYAFRGVGYHSAVLLAAAREYLPRDTNLIGLTTPETGELHPSFIQFFDSIETVFAPSRPSAPSAFIQMSPMTHDPTQAARLIGRANVFSATIVYDFIPFDMPDRYLANATAAEEYAVQLGWIQSYNAFFPISQYSAKRLEEICMIPKDRMSTTGVALRPEFEEEMNFARSSTRFAARPKLPTEFVVCVAGADRRKNVELLLEAHARLNQVCSDLHLVIVGSYGDNHVASLIDFYAKNGGSPQKLHFLSGITDAELTSVYSRATVAVCCSEIEGFSLPVIEAMACKCPILVSDIEAHRELVTSDEAVFGVHDVGRLSALIAAIANQPSLRARIVEAQAETAERFTAKRVCDRFWKPIAKGIRNIAGRVGRVSRHTFVNRPRVAILSPFPPEPSGVADYTRRTVQALGKIADVDVYTTASNPTPTPEVANFFQLSDTPYTSGQYDNVLTVIGNSHFHIPMIELQQAHGGPCLIHDNRLAELYNWWKGEEYLASMATKHLGRKVNGREVQHWMGNPGELPSMFFCELMGSSSPLIVHSRGIQAQCFKEHGIKPEYLPFCCYRDFRAEDLTATGKQAARSALGIGAEDFVIISLGIVGPSKGPFQCIEAIALVKKSGVNAHFFFVGTAGGLEAKLRTHAAELGVAENIHFCGEWVTEEDYYRYVVAADLAVQLRNHFFGGLSGAMLDCIGSGLATIANDDLAAALKSPESVIRIDDSLSSQELFEAILRVHRTQCYRDRLTPSRELYVKQHSFERYASQLLETLGLKTDSANWMNSGAPHRLILQSSEPAK